MLSLVKQSEPALSDARANLAAHQIRVRAAEAEYAELAAIQDAANEAARARKDALQVLDAVAELEAASWRAYVEDGAIGRPPEPKVELRADCASDLAAATARAEIAHRRAVSVEHQIAAAQAKLADLAKEQARRVAECLREEAETRVATRYNEHVAGAMRCEIEIAALANEAMKLGEGGIASAIRVLLRKGARSTWDEKLLDAGEPNDIRARTRRLAERLFGDAAANADTEN